MKKHLILTVSFLLLLLSGCTQKQEHAVTIGTNTWPGYEPLYLAEEKGFLPEGRFELKRLASASEVLQQFRNEKIDMAALTLDEALLLKDQNFDIKVILVMDISNGADVLIAQPGIDRLEELEGKRIGYENTALGSYMLERALETSGIESSTIIPLPAPLSEHERVFMDKAVDAVVTFEPVRTRLLAAGGVQLFDSSMIPGEIIDVLVARTGFVEANENTIRTLLASWGKAVDFLKSSPEEAAVPIARMEGISPTEFLESLKGLTLGCMSTNKQYLAGEKPDILTTIDHLQKIMQKYRFISEKPFESRELLYKGQADLLPPGL